MKYFIDTEFLEGSQKEKFPISLFKKDTPPTIDLISIGIVSEGGREYYAISKEFNLEEAWNRYDEKPNPNYIPSIGGLCDGSYNPMFIKEYWIRENVLLPIWRDLFFKSDDCIGLSNRQTEYYYQEIMQGDYDKYFSFKSIKILIERFGKTNKEIANDLIKIISPLNEKHFGTYPYTYAENVEFYAYYADYDWVAFCWLFGKMMDLPKGFPMYCKDLKQMLDDKIDKINHEAQLISPGCPVVTCKSMKENNPLYPKQENEHNALADARWNKKLYEFLIHI